ncbi:triacylglycerol lipase [Bacillus sp. OK048]|uniref:esterase/lipase family protein n=1 Tax=Bacillus sp. OK048 TaxID=1882761 RepID=UPI00088AF54A|nr:hypothetical protein [Bacillus sp. OK048]SDN06083.1 Triacylglycerol esterase/lipase EstA, alpha/beta hydrolase fold [Bacillus sp. OK048]
MHYFFRQNSRIKETKEGEIFNLKSDHPRNSLDNLLFDPYKNNKVDLFENHNKLGEFSFKDLPFVICSEHDIFKSGASKFLNGFFHQSKYNKVNDENFFIKVPNDIEAIYSINLNNIEQYEIVYSKHDSPGATDYIKVNDRSKLELLCYYNINSNGWKKAFIFIRSLKKNIKSLFSSFESRLYNISLNDDGEIIDTELRIEDNDYSDNKPMALIVHGFMSYTEGNFTSLKRELFERNYYGKIFGITYPSNRNSILTNGGSLYNVLKVSGLLEQDKKLDIYAHSEGGLVVRSMMSYFLDTPHSIDDVILAGTPNNGTPIAKFGNAIFSLIEENNIELLFNIIRDAIKTKHFSTNIFRSFIEQVALYNENSPALKDMDPGSFFLGKLNKRSFNINGNLFQSGYYLPEDDKEESYYLKALREILSRWGIFDGYDHHDGVVPFESTRYQFKCSNNRIIIEDDYEGWHSWYYGKDSYSRNIVKRVFEQK